jgi:hypothetical protein
MAPRFTWTIAVFVFVSASPRFCLAQVSGTFDASEMPSVAVGSLSDNLGTDFSPYSSGPVINESPSWSPAALGYDGFGVGGNVITMSVTGNSAETLPISEIDGPSFSVTGSASENVRLAVASGNVWSFMPNSIPDDPDNASSFQLPLSAAISGFVAPGDSVTFDLVVHALNFSLAIPDPTEELTLTDTISSPGQFSESASQLANVYFDGPSNTIDIGSNFSVEIDKGNGGGETYVNLYGSSVTVVVPEPASIVLAAFGAVACLLFVRRNRSESLAQLC